MMSNDINIIFSNLLKEYPRLEDKWDKYWIDRDNLDEKLYNNIIKYLEKKKIPKDVIDVIKQDFIDLITG